MLLLSELSHIFGKHFRRTSKAIMIPKNNMMFTEKDMVFTWFPLCFSMANLGKKWRTRFLQLGIYIFGVGVAALEAQRARTGTNALGSYTYVHIASIVSIVSIVYIYIIYIHIYHIVCVYFIYIYMCVCVSGIVVWICRMDV